jgi:hypothetical protein
MMADEIAQQFSRASASTQYKADYKKKKKQEKGKPTMFTTRPKNLTTAH